MEIYILYICEKISFVKTESEFARQGQIANLIKIDERRVQIQCFFILWSQDDFEY